MKCLSQNWVIVALAATGLFLQACTHEGKSYSVPGGANSSSATSPTAPAALPYYGVVDRRDCETVGGWVMNSAKPEEGLKVELYVDDKLIETLPAQTVRQDLTNKVGTGRYGFSFKIPASYKDEKQHEIHVKVVGENYTVPFFEGVFSNFVCKP